MPPNTVDLPPMDPEMMIRETKPNPFKQTDNEENYKLKIFQSSMNLLAHILIGMTVGVCFFFAVRNGRPLDGTPLHIILCVSGYHLLMAQAILSMSSENGWSFKLRLVDKRRAHWILQILGSGLAIWGSFHKILDKEHNGQPHWNTLHGKFALVALTFTIASLFNGLASLYAYEFRKCLPGNLSKITHVCFGTVAFCAASLTLIYGLDKNAFRGYATDPLAHACIAIVAAFTFIIIINPCLTFYRKSMSALKRN